jgi:hypothetical protein
VPQTCTGGAELRPVRRMRLRDQLEIPQEVIDGTVLYLSPHYRQVPASGSGLAGLAGAGTTATARSSMYLELMAQLGALGIRVVSVADATTTVAEQHAPFVLVLCPGFFSCPELVEETSQALASARTHKHTGFVTRL